MSAAHCASPWGLAVFLLNLVDPSSECYEVHQSLVTASDFELSFYLKYFGMTLLLEGPIYFLGLTMLPWPKRLLAIVVVNLATHPIIFYIFPLILSRFDATYSTYLLTAEIFAPVVEALLLWKLFKLSPSKAFSIAIAANLISWWLGVLLM